MNEDPTTYKKKLLVAIEVESKYPIDYLDETSLRRMLMESSISLAGDHIMIAVHTCPKLAAGSVDAAFQRIDKLEERLVGVFDDLLDRLRGQIYLGEAAKMNKPKHTF